MRNSQIKKLLLKASKEVDFVKNNIVPNLKGFGPNAASDSIESLSNYKVALTNILFTESKKKFDEEEIKYLLHQIDDMLTAIRILK